MGSSLNLGSPFEVPKIVRHPFKKDPQKRDPNLESYPDSRSPTLKQPASDLKP